MAMHCYARATGTCLGSPQLLYISAHPAERMGSLVREHHSAFPHLSSADAGGRCKGLHQDADLESD